MGIYLHGLFANPSLPLLVAIGGLLTNLVFRRLHKLPKPCRKDHHRQSFLFRPADPEGFLFQIPEGYGFDPSLCRQADPDKRKIQESNKGAGLISATLSSVREPLIILVVVLVIIVQVKYFTEYRCDHLQPSAVLSRAGIPDGNSKLLEPLPRCIGVIA